MVSLPQRVRLVPQPDSCTAANSIVIVGNSDWRAMNACRLIQLRRWRLPIISGGSQARAIWQSLD